MDNKFNVLCELKWQRQSLYPRIDSPHSNSIDYRQEPRRPILHMNHYSICIYCIVIKSRYARSSNKYIWRYHSEKVFINIIDIHIYLAHGFCGSTAAGDSTAFTFTYYLWCNRFEINFLERHLSTLKCALKSRGFSLTRRLSFYLLAPACFTKFKTYLFSPRLFAIHFCFQTYQSTTTFKPLLPPFSTDVIGLYWVRTQTCRIIPMPT